MGKQYMIRKISEMLECADIVTVESVYRVVTKLTVAEKRHFCSPVKIPLATIEHMFFNKGARDFKHSK